MLRMYPRGGGGGGGIQMGNFLILHPTGLLYGFNHKIPIFKAKSMKFGRHVPE